MSTSPIQNLKKRKLLRIPARSTSIPEWVKESTKNRELYNLAKDVINELPEITDFEKILDSRDSTENFINIEHKELALELKTTKQEREKTKHAKNKLRADEITRNVEDIEKKVSAIEEFIKTNDESIDGLTLLNDLYDLANKCRPIQQQKCHRVKHPSTNSRQKEYFLKDKHLTLVTEIDRIKSLARDSTEDIFNVQAFRELFDKVRSICRNKEYKFDI